MKPLVYLNRIETAVPPYEGHRDAVHFLSGLIARDKERSKFLGVAKHLGIEKRYTVLEHFFDAHGSDPKAFYRKGRFPTTAERMASYRREALPLASRVVKGLLTGVDLQKISHLIVTSCTGFYAPGLDVDILQAFGLSSRVQRTLLGYMGCYASISGLRLAQQMIQAEKDALVLMVNLELCTLHWRSGDIPFDERISHLLFSDGCAASLISARPAGLALEHFHSSVLPQSIHLMGWTIGDDGFFMNLDGSLPSVLSQALKRELGEILQNRALSDFQLWAVHPGGRSILDQIQSGLGLGEKMMQPSYDVLRQYGNMSSPTVMFILKRLLEETGESGLGCALAFGPGLTLQAFTFRKNGAWNGKR